MRFRALRSANGSKHKNSHQSLFRILVIYSSESVRTVCIYFNRFYYILSPGAVSLSLSLYLSQICIYLCRWRNRCAYADIYVLTLNYGLSWYGGLAVLAISVSLRRKIARFAWFALYYYARDTSFNATHHTRVYTIYRKTRGDLTLHMFICAAIESRIVVTGWLVLARCIV